MIALIALGSSAGLHAEEPVWDPEEIARLAEKSAQMAEALSRAVELLNNVNDLSRTIGRFGPLSNLDFTRFDTVEALKGAGPEIGGLAANIQGLGNVRIASFADATTFVNKLTTIPSGDNRTTSTGQIVQALANLQRKAAEDGFALATQTRESLTAAPQRAQLLVAQSSTAVNLRGDVGANTAATMAVLEQLASLKAMLGLMLEIQATRRLGPVVPAAAATP